MIKKKKKYNNRSTPLHQIDTFAAFLEIPEVTKEQKVQGSLSRSSLMGNAETTNNLNGGRRMVAISAILWLSSPVPLHGSWLGVCFFLLLFSSFFCHSFCHSFFFFSGKIGFLLQWSYHINFGTLEIWMKINEKICTKSLEIHSQFLIKC